MLTIRVKLIAGFLSLAFLVATIGYIGFEASGNITRLYAGKDSLFRDITNTANLISADVKDIESSLMLYLSINEQQQLLNYHDKIQRLEKHVLDLEQSETLKPLVEKIQSKLVQLKQTGQALLELKQQKYAADQVFDFKQHNRKVTAFHQSSSGIRKLGIHLADTKTAFLNKQKHITTASEISSYAARANGHLMLYLLLHDEIDREKYHTRYGSMWERIKTLQNMENLELASNYLPTIVQSANQLSKQASDLLRAYDNAWQQDRSFNYMEHHKSLLQLQENTNTIKQHAIAFAQVYTDWEVDSALNIANSADQIRTNIIVLSLVSMLLAMIFGYGLSLSISRPLEKLRHETQRLARGNFKPVDIGNTSGEIKQLADSFNMMISNLEKTHLHLVHAKQSAEKANLSKTQFLSKMSHELRTPLNAILGYGELLETEELTTQQQHDVQMIIKAGHHLLHLVEDILDLSRIEQNKLKLDISNFELNPIINESLALLTTLALQHDISLKHDINDSKHRRVIADSLRLKQCLINLINNAIKYNRAKGTVTISTKVDENQVYIDVADNGPGIAEQQMASLFKPFETSLNASNNRAGAGIGLSISKHLLEAMGGDLKVVNRAGEGCIFTIQIPCAGNEPTPASGGQTRQTEHSPA